MTGERVFRVTGDDLRELANSRELGPDWSRQFKEMLGKVEGDASVAAVGEFRAPTRVPNLVSEGNDLTIAIRSLCSSTQQFISDKPQDLLARDDFHLESSLQKLAAVVDMVEAIAAENQHES